jgi:hypothetical protein
VLFLLCFAFVGRGRGRFCSEINILLYNVLYSTNIIFCTALIVFVCTALGVVFCINTRKDFIV